MGPNVRLVLALTVVVSANMRGPALSHRKQTLGSVIVTAHTRRVKTAGAAALARPMPPQTRAPMAVNPRTSANTFSGSSTCEKEPLRSRNSSRICGA
jgi:hypothetical protein